MNNEQVSDNDHSGLDIHRTSEPDNMTGVCHGDYDRLVECLECSPGPVLSWTRITQVRTF